MFVRPTDKLTRNDKLKKRDLFTNFICFAFAGGCVVWGFFVEACFIGAIIKNLKIGFM